MPVTESFLRTSTLPAVMKNMELPGAPSRTMIWLGGKSRRFIRFTTSEHSRMESPLKSLMRWRKCCASAGGAGVTAGAGAAAAEEPSADMEVVIAALAGVDMCSLLLESSQSYPMTTEGEGADYTSVTVVATWPVCLVSGSNALRIVSDQGLASNQY